MELKGQGRLVEARAAFDELVAGFPDYVPTYLHAASTLTALGERDLAAEMLRKGIAAAIAKPDAHARKELEAALAEI